MVKIIDPRIPETIIQVDTPDGNTTYVGEAKIGTATAAASWKIFKVVKSGTATSVRWAAGAQAFNQIWDNRASLSYS